MITKDEKVKLGDEYAYVKLHFDVPIPEGLYVILQKTEVKSVCETDKKTKNK